MLSLKIGDHITRPQYGIEGKSRVRFIEGLAITRAVKSKLVLTVSAQNWKKIADNAVDDERNPRSLAPVEMQSSQGRLLMAMLNDREPFEMISRVASQQLGRLAAASTPSSHTGHFNAHEGVLYRRIADIKEKERSRALQDIIYALVASSMVDAMVALPDPLISAHLLPGQHDVRMEDAIVAMPEEPLLLGHLHRRDDDRLQAIQSPDVKPLIERHVAMVIHGKDHSNIPFQPHAFARVCKFEMGKMYAASVMYGHFLTRVHQRFKLDRGLQVEAGGSMGSATMEAYMEVGFDAETLHHVSRMRCTHSVDVIERHVEALFGKAPVHMQHLEHRRSSLINIQLGNVRSLILEALAFGALLWDVEYNFIPLCYPLCLED